MTDDTPEIALVRRFFTLVSSNQFDAAIDLLADDVVYHNIPCRRRCAGARMSVSSTRDLRSGIVSVSTGVCSTSPRRGGVKAKSRSPRSKANRGIRASLRRDLNRKPPRFACLLQPIAAAHHAASPVTKSDVRNAAAFALAAHVEGSPYWRDRSRHPYRAPSLNSLHLQSAKARIVRRSPIKA